MTKHSHSYGCSEQYLAASPASDQPTQRFSGRSIARCIQLSQPGFTAFTIVVALSLLACSGDNRTDPTVDAESDVQDTDGGEDVVDDGINEDGRDGDSLCNAVSLPSARPLSATVPKFELNRQTILDQHVFTVLNASDDPLGYGGGGALWDYNTDGLVDVFLGRSQLAGTPPCLYENTSAANDTSFRRAQCFSDLPVILGATVADWDDDGEIELLLFGPDVIVEISYNGALSRRVLFEQSEGCEFNAVLTAPEQSNQLIIGFGVSTSESRPSPQDLLICQPVLLSQDESGAVTVEPWELTSFRTVVLALGRVDIDQDGILDTLIVSDTFSNEETKNTNLHPGGFVRGVVPGDTSTTRFSTWAGSSNRSWGSFMGADQVVLGDSAHTMLSDWGAPLLRSAASGDDAVGSVGVDLSGDPYPFSWSPIVADFNGDHADDILLTRGAIRSDDSSTEADLLLMQAADGELVNATQSSGLLAHPPAFTGSESPEHLSRAGTATDFDRDGKLEVLILPYRGRPLLYESNLATHCLARVQSPYLSSRDRFFGWSWLDADGIAHPLRTDAHMRLGESAWLPVPAGAGVLRSPTGARVTYSCEPGQRIDVVEPRWIAIDGDSVNVDTCLAGIRVADVTAFDGSGLTPNQPDTLGDHAISFSLRSAALILRVNDRFSLVCASDRGCSR